VLRDGNFACRIHPAAPSAIDEQQWVTGFHCVCSVVGWLIVYQLGIYYLYSVANTVRPSVDAGEMKTPA
jgi:hypothetical protein